MYVYNYFNLPGKTPNSVWPKEIAFEAKYEKECKSNAIKTNKKYFIRKHLDLAENKVDIHYTFSAYLQESDKRGNDIARNRKCHTGMCNGVTTEEGYKKCGMSSKVMYYCLVDKDITGDVEKILNSKVFQEKSETFINDDGERRNRIINYCRKFGFFENAADPAISAAGYFTAAMLAGYDKMLVRNYFKDTIVLDLEKAKAEYVGAMYEHAGEIVGPTDFKDKYLNKWFFCDCKDENTNNCDHII